MVRSKGGVSNDMFIVDTDCLGSHVFRTSELLTRVTSVSANTHEVKDFSGNAHQTTCKGYLLDTNQQVLVMPHAKVNLLSTEQMFKDNTITCAMLMETHLYL
jgi:hypothetical protein